ncbi:hypothetical protein T10_4317 [Trichinella papuae]|uniref:Uncharacterized protein n=1 Tax=Trichinella papuae TaxID=268474 RepID=A0A0V1MI81_9BILA|nr:hypothetical protein T10_4317 [Trichinella papuae]
MVTPWIAFRAEPDRHDLKWRNFVMSLRPSRWCILLSNGSQNDLNCRISPSNFGKGTGGGFTCSAAGVKFAVCLRFTAGPFPFSLKKIPAWLRVSNTSLDNSSHSRSVASSASPSGSASSNAT